MATLLGCDGQGYKCCEGCLRKSATSEHKLSFVRYKPSEYNCLFHLSPSFLKICQAHGWEPKLTKNTVEV